MVDVWIANFIHLDAFWRTLDGQDDEQDNEFVQTSVFLKCVLNTTAGCWALSVECLKRSLVLSYFFGVISMVIFEVWNPEISNLELQPFHIQSLFGGLDSRTQEILGSHRIDS